MYAADSAFTHALSRETVRQLAAPRRAGADRRAAAARRRSAGRRCRPRTSGDLTADDGWHGPDVALVLAAHGTLLAPAEADRHRPGGDRGAVRRPSPRACRRASASSSHGWLNHTRGGRWTEPPIEAALERRRGGGLPRVVYYPYGFLADNAESELEGRIALAAHPAIAARHLPCLNDSAPLLAAIADQVRAAGGEACPASREH